MDENYMHGNWGQDDQDKIEPDLKYSDEKVSSAPANSYELREIRKYIVTYLLPHYDDDRQDGMIKHARKIEEYILNG